MKVGCGVETVVPLEPSWLRFVSYVTPVILSHEVDFQGSTHKKSPRPFMPFNMS